jgi:hypothetical protein
MAMRHRLSWSSILLTLAASLTAAVLSSCSGAAAGVNQGGQAKVTPSITWASPSPITNPIPLSATQLDATANVPGSFVYIPPAGTVLAAGTQTLSVTFTPTNQTAYNNAQASVSITVNPQIQTLDAYLYVSTAPNSIDNNVDVYAYSAASDGTLTPVSGSPFSSPGGLQTTNGKYLFGSDGIGIYSYSVASDGALQQVASIDAQQFNSKNLSGAACGGPSSLFFDVTGATLYDLDFYSDCANNAYQFFSVDNSTGGLSYLGVTAATTPIFDVALSLLGNNQFAYGASCYHWYQEIFGFARNRDGSLTSMSVNPTLTPMPASKAGQIYCPYLTATDSTNHVAVAVQPLDNSSLQPVGSYQLATYGADGSGKLTTTSTYSNMPTTSVTNISDASLTCISMSPSGQLLAVAGTGGLQVFHFNGANPITSYTGPLTTDQVDKMFWDKDNHLYAISQSAGKLYVFTITPTVSSQASGSPYILTSPANIVALPPPRGISANISVTTPLHFDTTHHLRERSFQVGRVPKFINHRERES